MHNYNGMDKEVIDPYSFEDEQFEKRVLEVNQQLEHEGFFGIEDILIGHKRRILVELRKKIEGMKKVSTEECTDSQGKRLEDYSFNCGYQEAVRHLLTMLGE